MSLYTAFMTEMTLISYTTFILEPQSYLHYVRHLYQIHSLFYYSLHHVYSFKRYNSVYDSPTIAYRYYVHPVYVTRS